MAENDLRIAYLLQVHKNPQQLNRFIRQITVEGNVDVYIHVDKKSVRAMTPEICEGANIKIIEQSVDVKWGDISQVDATLCLLRNLKASNKTYDFVWLKSGQDLLVKKGFRDHLARNLGKIFMAIRKFENRDPDAYFWSLKWPAFMRNQYDSILHPYRIARFIFIRLYKAGLNLIPNPNKLPATFAMYKGSQWFGMPGDLTGYIIDFLEKNPWYYQSFEQALAPDEVFFHTLIMNSPYAANVINDNLTYLRFGQSYKDSSHAVTLTLKDVPETERSGKFFARKFDEDIDREVIDYFCNKGKFAADM